MRVAYMKMHGRGACRIAIYVGARQFRGRNRQRWVVGPGPPRTVGGYHHENRLHQGVSPIRGYSSTTRALRFFNMSADTPPRSDKATTTMLMTMKMALIGSCRKTR